MNLKNIFPNAKYVESSQLQLEDDIIYLTKNLYIQVCEDGEYLLYEKIGPIYKNHCINKDLQKVVDVAIIVAFKDKNFSLN